MSGDGSTRVTFTDVLRIREFRALFGAQVLSLIGDNLAKVAVALLVFDRYHSALLTGLTYGLTFLPWLVGGPLLAALADRLPRRGVMIRCDLWRALLVALIAVPGIPVAFLLALILLVSLLEPAFRAARSALMPEVLGGGPNYATAMNLSGLANTLSTAAGFAIGGALVAVTGVRTAILLDAGTFLASAATVATFIAPRQLARSQSPRIFRDLIEGFRYVLGDPRLLWLALASALAASATMGAIAVAVPLTAAHGADQLVAGLLTAAPTSGVFVGVLVVGRLLPAPWADRLMVPLALLAPLFMIAVWGDPPIWVSAACFVASGACVSMSVTANRVFVEAVDPAFRGRAFGIAGAFVSGFQGLSAFLTGWLADHLGPARAVASTGVLTFVALAVITLLTGQWRRDQSSGRYTRMAQATSPIRR